MELDGEGLKELIIAGTTWLKTNQETVNALNVFPVPDGDTGTNMVLTMQAAIAEMGSNRESNAGKVTHAVAQGALMGARGNSGVILSQIWRGFARAMDAQPKMDAKLLVNALGEARNTAYKGVVRPVEGTILTVIKDISHAAEAKLDDSSTLRSILETIVAEGSASVARTPELLPILKQAGVVDSGGKGLFYIFEGMLRFVNGLRLDVSDTGEPIQKISQMNNLQEEIEPGQEVEVVIDFTPHKALVLDDFYRDLGEIGTSIQIGEGDGYYRMHIHTTAAQQYEPIHYIAKIGTWQKIAMENLVAQMDTRSGNSALPDVPLATVEKGQVAIVAVSPGKGISNVFASLGANAIIAGGQTMNPSTEEILESFQNLPSDHIIILPNNKNIILAAENAAAASRKKIAVIPSRTIPQGISALFRFNPESGFDELVEQMKEAVGEVRSGEITIATRSVEINGVNVKEGETIGLLDGKIVTSAETLDAVLLEILAQAGAGHLELVTMFAGSALAESEAERLVGAIQENYPNLEVELKPGGQPHYHLILGIE